MTKPLRAEDIGIEGYKVRIVLPNVVVWALSRTEPELTIDRVEDRDIIKEVRWEPIEGTAYGDTVGFIRWEDVKAMTWRKL